LRIFRSLALVGMVSSFVISAIFHIFGFDNTDAASSQVFDLGAGVVQGLDIEDLYLAGSSSAEVRQLSAQMFRHAYASDVQNLMFPVFIHRFHPGPHCLQKFCPILPSCSQSV